MIRYTFQKKLMLIELMHQKNVIFVIIWYFLDKGFKFESCLSNGCLYLIQKVIDFNDPAIVSVKRNDYRIHF